MLMSAFLFDWMSFSFSLHYNTPALATRDKGRLSTSSARQSVSGGQWKEFQCREFNPHRACFGRHYSPVVNLTLFLSKDASFAFWSLGTVQLVIVVVIIFLVNFLHATHTHTHTHSQRRLPIATLGLSPRAGEFAARRCTAAFGSNPQPRPLHV